MTLNLKTAIDSLGVFTFQDGNIDNFFESMKPKPMYRCRTCGHVGAASAREKYPTAKHVISTSFRTGGALGGLIGAAITAALPVEKVCQKCLSEDIEIVEALPPTMPPATGS